MSLEYIEVAHGEGRCQVKIWALITHEGLSLTLTGGEKPHVGGTVLCVPRKSLSGEGSSCDTWVSPVPGHKDTVAAIPVAEKVCRATGQVTAVVAGIHIKDAAEGELKELVDNSLEAARKLVAKIKEQAGD